MAGEQVFSAGTKIGALLETAGHSTQSMIIGSLGPMFHSIAACLYVLAVIGAIVSIVIFGSFRAARYLLLGPTLFFVCFFEKANSYGVKQEFGKRQQVDAAAAGNLEIKLSPIPVSRVFLFITGVIDGVVRDGIDLIVRDTKLTPQKMTVRPRALENLVNPKVTNTDVHEVVGAFVTSCPKLVHNSLILADRKLDPSNLNLLLTNALRIDQAVQPIIKGGQPITIKLPAGSDAGAICASADTAAGGQSGVLEALKTLCRSYKAAKEGALAGEGITVGVSERIREYSRTYADGMPAEMKEGDRIKPVVSCKHYWWLARRTLAMQALQLFNQVKEAYNKRKVGVVGVPNNPAPRDIPLHEWCGDLRKRMLTGATQAPPPGEELPKDIVDLIAQSNSATPVRDPDLTTGPDRGLECQWVIAQTMLNVSKAVFSADSIRSIVDGMRNDETIVAGDIADGKPNMKFAGELHPVMRGGRRVTQHISDETEMYYNPNNGAMPLSPTKLNASYEPFPGGEGFKFWKYDSKGVATELTLPSHRITDIGPDTNLVSGNFMEVQVRSLRQGLYSFALNLPYWQGVLLYLLGVAWPFMTLVLLLPGRAPSLLLFPMAWLWVKSWDLGFAFMVIFERVLWNTLNGTGIPNLAMQRATAGKPIGLGGSGDDKLYEFFRAAFSADPLSYIYTYYFLLSMAVLSIPAITGYATLRAKKAVLSSFVDGPRAAAQDSSQRAGAAYSAEKSASIIKKMNESSARAQHGAVQNFRQTAANGGSASSDKFAFITTAAPHGISLAGGLLAPPGGRRGGAAAALDKGVTATRQVLGQAIPQYYSTRAEVHNQEAEHDVEYAKVFDKENGYFGGRQTMLDASLASMSTGGFEMTGLKSTGGIADKMTDLVMLRLRRVKDSLAETEAEALVASGKLLRSGWASGGKVGIAKKVAGGFGFADTLAPSWLDGSINANFMMDMARGKNDSESKIGLFGREYRDTKLASYGGPAANNGLPAVFYHVEFELPDGSNRGIEEKLRKELAAVRP